MLALLADPRYRWTYLACTLLGTSFGTGVSVLSLALRRRGLETTQIATLATAYAAAITVASIPIASLVRRLGARRSLVLSLCAYSLVAMAYVFSPTFSSTLSLRLIDGAVSVMIWVAAETGLLERSTDGQRASTISLYTAALSVGYIIGPLLANQLVGDGHFSRAFWMSSALSIAAALSAQLQPRDARPERPSNAGEGDTKVESAEPRPLASMVWLLRGALLAVFTYGFFQSSLLVLMPIYLEEERRFAASSTLHFSAAFAAGMLLGSPGIGRIADRFGAQRTLPALALVGAASVLAFSTLESYGVMLGAVLLAGAVTTSAWPVSLAIQGGALARGELSKGSALINALYAMGLVLGPSIASRAFARWHGRGLFTQYAALWAIVALVGLHAARTRKPSSER